MNCYASKLDEWVDAAILTNFTYHRTRSEFWESLVEILYTYQPEEKEGDAIIKISKPLFRSIKSFLTGKDYNSDSTLAFETGLDQLQGLLHDAEDIARGNSNSKKKSAP